MEDPSRLESGQLGGYGGKLFYLSLIEGIQ